MNNYTITELATLPSKGKLYPVQINPELTLRSMTTNEEMRRLGKSDRRYKNIADVIDECIIEETPMSCYDMHIGDFQYLLHKLRIATYGDDYPLVSTCPYCGSTLHGTIKLSDMKVNEYSEDILKYMEFDLPVSKKHIKLKYQTPRMLDDVLLEVNERKKKSSAIDQTLVVTICKLIDTVDNQNIDIIKKEDFVRSLPMADTNTILKHAEKISESIGIDTSLLNTCEVCGLDYPSTFRTTGEFFGPSIRF